MPRTLEDVCRRLSDEHCLLSVYTLLKIFSSGGIGRKKLAETLGVGEATARTVLVKLKTDDLVRSDRSGTILTMRGREAAEGIAASVFPAQVILDEVYGRYMIGFIVRGATSKLGTGIKERDEAIRGGADGALILLYTDGRTVFPGLREEYRGIRNILPQPKEGDCLIIAWASSLRGALLGALRSSFSLACGE